jgi:glycosyltransferase involved in cell wall biosynthesis
LVAPDSTDALAEGLARILNDETFRAKAGAAGEAAVRARYTAEVMARDTAALLSEFVSAPTTANA